MEESHAAAASNENGVTANAANGGDHGWQKVTYVKRQRKTKPNAAGAKLQSDAPLADGADNVFRSLEQQSQERSRRILESQRAAENAAAAIDARTSRSNNRSSVYDDDDDDTNGSNEEGNGKVEVVKKVKSKKPKKPKVSLNDVASKIDAAVLASFLEDISISFKDHEDIQLMRFADYFGRAFSLVAASQFPWVKIFRESPVTKMVDVPLSFISEAVYKTSVDWISKRPVDSLATFVLWALDTILAELTNQIPVAKGSKKGVQQVSSKSQVAIFVVVAMVLRRKPDVLVNILPTLREDSKYQGLDKLPVIIWLITQASQGDLSVGLYAWASNLLPLVSGKTSNPQSRDLVLQLVEMILSTPKARPILVNGAVRKGERLIPPSSFEILMHATFPQSSARVKATERFGVIYPTLKDVALGGSPGSKAVKQAAQKISNFSLKASGESIPELSREASSIFIWCLTQSNECYNQWEKVYQENLEGSVSVLRDLCDKWKEQSPKLYPLDRLRASLKNFKQKNEKGLAGGEGAAGRSLFKDADKYCDILLGRLSGGHSYLKFLTFTVIAATLGAVYMSPNVDSLDMEKLSEYFSSLLPSS